MNLGCSSFTWKTNNNKHLLGRTYDQFGTLDRNKIIVVPKGYEIYLDNETVEKNRVFVKHSFVGMAVLGLKTPILVDGVNDKGLMGALLHYPEFAKYDRNKVDDVIDINPGFFVSYILGECANIEEIIKIVKKINLKDENVFGEPIPVHYIFSDRSGETIIIEPDEDGLTVHRNTIGVMTNSPNYSWHKQNLNNYSWVNNEAIEPKVICGENFNQYEITGMVMPGDYSSPSRFIKVALMKNFAPLGEDEIDGITRMLHCFSTVDIPDGIKAVNVPSGGYKGTYYEKTLCMSAVCSESLTYYYTVSTNRRICAINLNCEKKNKDIKYFDLEKKQDILYLN